MAVGAGKEPRRPRPSHTRFLFASHWALRCGSLHRRNTPRLVEVLLEDPHGHLRPDLQRGLGDQFMVSAGGEPDASQVIIVTGPEPERVTMLRDAYPAAGIFVLESAGQADAAGLACLEVGADGLVVGRSVADLVTLLQALVPWLFGSPALGRKGRAEGIQSGRFIDENHQGGQDVN
jgi:hypothetical protein